MMEVTTESSKKERFLEAFIGHEHTSDANAHVAERYRIAREALSRADFPTTRVEDWKYTRVGKIANASWKLHQSTADVDGREYTIPGLDCHRLVFVNGYYRADLSQPIDGGLVVLPMSDALASHADEVAEVYGHHADDEQSIFTALNTSFATDGAFISIAKGVQADKPVHLVYYCDTNGVAAQTRNLIKVAESAEVSVIQSMITPDGLSTFSNMATEMQVGQNARLTIDKIQMGPESALVNCLEKGSQARDSHYRLNTYTLSGGWVRNTSEMTVAGTNCGTDLYGTYMPTGKSHVDNHTTIDHTTSDCESNELYKGIIYDAATGVFNGKVYVRQDAQRIDAFQQNANIVMTENGSMNSKPELEIYADDVKCSHGSTTGQFDEEALFYLMSRGISRGGAKRLLVAAFVADVIDKSGHEAVRDYLLSKIETS